MRIHARKPSAPRARALARSLLLPALLAFGACERTPRPTPAAEAAEPAGPQPQRVAAAGEGLLDRVQRVVPPSEFDLRRAMQRVPLDGEDPDHPLLEALLDARRVAAGDLTGDGKPELVIVDDRWLRVTDAAGTERLRTPVPGGIQVLHVADVDGNGKAEILAGWGRTRNHTGARARVSLYRIEGPALAEQVLLEPSTIRNDVVEVLPTGPGELLIAHFEDKFHVLIEKARLVDGAWQRERIDSLRMATRLAVGDVDGDGKPDLVVGRVYGDDPDADVGDAFVLRPDGTREHIPVQGGVRSLALADLNGDGRLEILLGEGWHRHYVRHGRARLTRAWWTQEGFQSELLEESPGQFALWDLAVADLDGTGKQAVVTRGNAEVRVVEREAAGWRGRTIASLCDDVGAFRLGEGTTLLLLCEGAPRVLRPGKAQPAAAR